MSPVAYLMYFLSLPTAPLKAFFLGLLAGDPDSLRLLLMVNLAYALATACRGEGEGARLRVGFVVVIGLLLPVGLWSDGQLQLACGMAVLGMLLPYGVVD